MDGFDTSGDGVADTYTADVSGNTVADTLATDTDQNGLLESYAFDQNENGVAESFAVDANENGVLEVVAFDVNEDGVIDYRIEDMNENGVNDAAETSPSSTIGVVGPATRPAVENPYGLPFVDEVQRIGFDTAMGFPNSDGDIYTDPNDFHPNDPNRR